MDNKIFNVNGEGKDWLLQVIKLAFRNPYGEGERKPDGWKYYPSHGLVFLWHVHKDEKGAHKFPTPVDSETATNIAWDWLQGDEAKGVPMTGWDADADHDGSNELGWRVYCEEWGYVASNHYALIAVKPAYMWYGK